MAQQRQKRRRKHRGTQGGRVDRKSRTSRPLNREEARQRYRQERMQQPPTWRSAANRAVIAAAIFGVVVVLLGQKIGVAISLAVLMLAFYIPLGYWVDRFFYNRRQRRGG